MTQSRYFAVYLQMAKNGFREQYIFLPRQDTSTHGYAYYFRRIQRRTDHRTIWRFGANPWAEPDMQKSLITRVETFEGTEWEVSPPVVVELSQAELRDIITERKTPYRLLARFKRTAKTLYSLDIS